MAGAMPLDSVGLRMSAAPLDSYHLRKAGSKLINSIMSGKQHAGFVQPLLNMVSGQGVTVGDKSGSVQLGPAGLSVSRTTTEGRPVWDMSIDPRSQSAQFTRGGLTVGGSWNSANPGVSVGYQSGGNRSTVADPEIAAVSAADEALKSWDERRPAYTPPSPREELEMQLARRRAEDPRWYVP